MLFRNLSQNKSKANKTPTSTGRKRKKTNIYQYDNITGLFIKWWDNTEAVSKFYGCNECDVIYCVRNKRQYSGYIWSRKELDKIDVSDYIPEQDSSIRTNNYKNTAMYKVDFDNNILKEYSNNVEAGKELGFSALEITRLCLGLNKTKLDYKLIYKSKYIKKC